MEDAKERKMRQYEKLLRARVAEEGVESIEALLEKKKAEKDPSLAASLGLKGTESDSAQSQLEKKDLELAARIRELAEKETKRKLESGELDSRPGGSGSGEDSGPIKALSKIIDVEKLRSEPTDKIKELWTKYHTLKGKLSAVIPRDTYERLVKNAKQYPQFVLPLPREIIGGDESAASNLAPGEKKQGYEMQFMEWGFLPSPQGSKTTPTTVLFTPLAEYKLRQEFAQPLLVLTHYTDLSDSNGVVLMRGEITSSEEIEANPTGIAAAESAKSKGAPESEQERLKNSPVQSSQGGKMSDQDAQLLAMTMQRFYLPDATSQSGKEREQLLRDFHVDKEAFSVQRLCEVAFTL